MSHYLEGTILEGLDIDLMSDDEGVGDWYKFVGPDIGLARIRFSMLGDAMLHLNTSDSYYYKQRLVALYFCGNSRIGEYLNIYLDLLKEMSCPNI